MAGIVVDASKDIKKLQELRKEIEAVKQSLKGINVNVNIDIAKGLEEQLKSLMEQYDALAQKVAKTEADIALSVKRINDASEKIIKAQEKISQISGTSSNPISEKANNTESVNTSETASIQAQAKAYDNLRTEIDGILGTRAQNIKRMIEEQNIIRVINDELKKLSKLQGVGGLSTAQQKRLEQLNNSLLTHKIALAEVRQSLANNVKLDNAASSSMNGLSQSLSRMRNAYRELTEEERRSPFGKELLTSINQADAKIKALDATIGNHQRNVGDYSRAWNGLSVSIQNIGRELPSLAYGAKVFFSAISNNIGPLADEIKRASREYKAMVAQGQKATPVWKQVVSSLISWQTALTVGITLLTLYGDKLVDWIAGLFTAKKALSETYAATEEFQKSVIESSSTTITQLAKLSAKWNELGKDIKAQEKFILDNKDAFNSMGVAINSVEEAENLLINNKDAFIESIKAKAKSTSIMKLASEEYERYLLKMKEAEEMPETTSQYVQTSTFGTGYYVTGDNAAKKQKEKDAKKYLESFNKLIDDAISAEEEGVKKVNNAGIKLTSSIIDGSVGAIKATIAKYQKDMDDVTDPKKYREIEAKIKAEQAKLEAITGPKKDNTNQITEQQNRVAKLMRENALSRIRLQIDLENQVDQSRIDAMNDGFEKDLAQRELNDKKELEAISRQKQEYIKKVIDMEEEAFNAIEESKAKKNKDYKKRAFDRSSVSVDASMFDVMADNTIKKQVNENTEYYKELLSKYQDYTSKRLEAQKKFDKDRVALEKTGASKEQINELEYQREEAMKAIDSEFAMREESYQSWMDSIANLSLTKLREQLMLAKEELQRYELMNPNDPQLATMRAQIAYMEKTEKSLSSKQSISPNKRGIKEWQDLYSTLQKVDKEFAEIGDTVGGTAGEIIKTAGSITTSTLQMIDGIMTLSEDSAWSIEKTATVAAKAVKIVENASVILAVVSGALSIATKIANLFGGKSSYEKYEEAKKVYDSYISVLDKVIERQLELAESLSGENAHAAYQEALDLYQTQIEAARILGKQYLNSREKRQHSKGYKEVEEMSAEGWNQAANAMGLTVSKFKELMNGRMTGLFDLTEEDLIKLQKEAPVFWAQLDKDTQDYANKIVDGVKDITEVLEQEMENLTGVSFSSFSDDILDSLYDVESSAKDIFDDMSDYMRKAMIKAMYVKNYEPEMRKWYEQWAEAMKNDGIIDESEQASLDALKESIILGATSAAEAINKQFGTSSYTQEATFGTSLAADQDSVNELSGRFTALQMTGEEIKNESVTQTELLSSINDKLSFANLTDESISALMGNATDFVSQSEANNARMGANQQINVTFPTNELIAIAVEVKNVKDIVDEMRTKQIESSMDIQIIAESSEILSKNSPKVLSTMGEIKSKINY